MGRTIKIISVLLRNCQVKSLLWNARGISPEGLAFEKEKRLSPRNKTKKCHLKVAPRQGGARSEASSERKEVSQVVGRRMVGAVRLHLRFTLGLLPGASIEEHHQLYLVPQGCHRIGDVVKDIAKQWGIRHDLVVAIAGSRVRNSSPCAILRDNDVMNLMSTTAAAPRCPGEGLCSTCGCGDYTEFSKWQIKRLASKKTARCKACVAKENMCTTIIPGKQAEATPRQEKEATCEREDCQEEQGLQVTVDEGSDIPSPSTLETTGQKKGGRQRKKARKKQLREQGSGEGARKFAQPSPAPEQDLGDRQGANSVVQRLTCGQEHEDTERAASVGRTPRPKPVRSPDGSGMAQSAGSAVQEPVYHWSRSEYELTEDEVEAEAILMRRLPSFRAFVEDLEECSR